jgi:hypothetical protein
LELHDEASLEAIKNEIEICNRIVNSINERNIIEDMTKIISFKTTCFTDIIDGDKILLDRKNDNFKIITYSKFEENRHIICGRKEIQVIDIINKANNKVICTFNKTIIHKHLFKHYLLSELNHSIKTLQVSLNTQLNNFVNNQISLKTFIFSSFMDILNIEDFDIKPKINSKAEKVESILFYYNVFVQTIFGAIILLLYYDKKIK